VKSAASDSSGITDTPRKRSSEMNGFAACRVLEICPLLPVIRTGRVEPLNFATGTTRSDLTLTFSTAGKSGFAGVLPFQHLVMPHAALNAVTARLITLQPSC